MTDSLINFSIRPTLQHGVQMPPETFVILTGRNMMPVRLEEEPVRGVKVVVAAAARIGNVAALTDFGHFWEEV